MKFNIVFLSLIAMLLTINCAINPRTVGLNTQAQKIDGTSTEFPNLRDSITQELLRVEPEERRMLGDSLARGQLKDWSPKAIKEMVEFCRGSLKKINAIQVSNPAEQLDRKVLAAHLTYLEHYYGHYHGELGNLHISAYPYEVIQYELQRFATSKRDTSSAQNHYGAIEGLLRGLPGYLEQQQSNLTAGLRLRPPDKEILSRTVNRIGSVGDKGSIRGGLKEMVEELESAKMQSILPASQREILRNLLQRADKAYELHADFLTRELGPQARDSWPLGKDEYERRFALIYIYPGSLDGLVREAEAELRRVKDEMISLARKLRPNLSLRETLEELYKKHPATDQELLKAYEQVQERIDNGITRRLGLQTGAVSYLSAPAGVPVSPATNWPAPLLSSGQGIVLVDTSPAGLNDNTNVDLTWIAAHEGNPGHAAQSFLFQKAFKEGSAPLCRFLNVPDEVGYVRGNWYSMANIEGWAFYTERLLLASNLLAPEERLAALAGQALRAARVIVDVHMHTAGWSRSDAEKYLEKEAGQLSKVARREAYRYSRIPLQALSYYLGARQFEELYNNYAERCGDGFYRQVLSLGPVPPPLIGDYLKSTMK